VTAPSAGNIQSVTLYHNGGSGGIILGVYADDGGLPGTRLGVTPEVTINSSEGWQTINLSSQVAVSAGQTVWLAWVTESGAATRADDGTPGRAASGVGWSGGMPSDFGSASTADYVYSVYATYSGGGCTPDCSGKNCGDDGCGGSCGTCSGGQTCQSGVCTDPPASGCTVISGAGTHSGSNVGASNDWSVSGFDCDDSDDSGLDVCYEWTASVSGTHEISTCDLASHDTILTIWNAAGSSQLVCNDDGSGCADYTSEISFDAVAGTTYIIVVDAWRSDRTGSFDLSITAPAGCTPDCSGKNCGDDGCGGSCGTCSGGQTCQSGVCTDPPASGCTVISGAGTHSGSNVGASNDWSVSGFDCDDSDDTGLDVCYEWTPSVSGTHEISTCDLASHDTILTIWNAAGSSQLVCNDDGSGCADYTSEISFDAVAGTTYIIVVDAWRSDRTGSFDLNITAPAGCTPDCSGKNCGDDGCGGSCGTCSGGQVCNSGTCEDPPAGGDFGNTTVYPNSSSATDRRAQPVTAPSAGNIQSITIYHNGGSGGIILGVYADNGGVPGARLGVTSEVTINSSQGWQTINLQSQVSVSTGQTVWLAWVTESGAQTRADDGSPGRAASGQGWSGGMPTDFGSASTANYVYSIYATYAP
jgi:hypothetical protein